MIFKGLDIGGKRNNTNRTVNLNNVDDIRSSANIHSIGNAGNMDIATVIADVNSTNYANNTNIKCTKGVLGIIAEYNPFHNGHLYHLQKSIKHTSAEFVVCVMSGNFVQRGEPAIINKWARAKMALSMGVDIVIELPLIYAVSSAEFFAQGGVKTLDSLGIIDYLSFGSEVGEITPLRSAAEILTKEPKLYKELLKQGLDTGLSYAGAVEYALTRYPVDFFENISSTNVTHGKNISNREHCNDQFNNKNVQQTNTGGQSLNLAESPNNILGIEYLKTIKKEGSPIIPITIKRMSSQYKTDYLTGKISSATAIRNDIMKNIYYSGYNHGQCHSHVQCYGHRCSHNHIYKQSQRQGHDLVFDHSLIHDPKNLYTWRDSYENTLPLKSLAILKREFTDGKGPISYNSYGNMIISSIRKMKPVDIKAFLNVGEGLENRIKKAANQSSDLNELINSVCTRRYTRTRIQRLFLHILLNITASEFKEFREKGPQYIRILGFTKKGAHLLSIINKNATLPVVTKTSIFANNCNVLAGKMLELDALATDIYVLGYKNQEFRKARQDFTNPPVI